MSDLELTLTLLGEMAAVEFHRDHNSQGFERLQADVRDESRIMKTRKLGSTPPVERKILHAVDR
jgi:hypothetical protein